MTHAPTLDRAVRRVMESKDLRTGRHLMPDDVPEIVEAYHALCREACPVSPGILSSDVFRLAVAFGRWS